MNKAEEVKRKNSLLRKLRSKEITMEQFLRECYMWTVEVIESFQFLKLPIKPKVVEGYELLPDGVRSNLAKEYFNDHPQVLEYYRQVTSAKNINQALYNWLKDCMKLVDTAEARSILEKKLEEVKETELLEKKL